MGEASEGSEASPSWLPGQISESTVTRSTRNFIRSKEPTRKNKRGFSLEELIKSLHEAGGLRTTGTDSSFMVGGAIPEQIHRELELLVEAGLSNYW